MAGKRTASPEGEMPLPTPAVFGQRAKRTRGKRSGKVNVGLVSSDSPEWYTPMELIETIILFLGEITLDPCSDAKHRVPATQHYTQYDMGEMQSWANETVYMNPPYGDVIGDWVAKACTEPVKEIVMLLPGRLDTQWFQRWLTGYPLCIIEGRLNFEKPDGTSHDAAPFPSILVYRGPRSTEEFARAFSLWGPTYPPAIRPKMTDHTSQLRLLDALVAQRAARHRDTDPGAALVGLFAPLAGT